MKTSTLFRACIDAYVREDELLDEAVNLPNKSNEEIQRKWKVIDESVRRNRQYHTFYNRILYRLEARDD